MHNRSIPLPLKLEMAWDSLRIVAASIPIAHWRGAYLFPLLAWVGVIRNGLSLADVDGDVSWIDPPLELAHLWMLTTAPEQSRWLHPEVAHLDGIQKAQLLDYRSMCTCRGLE